MDFRVAVAVERAVVQLAVFILGQHAAHDAHRRVCKDIWPGALPVGAVNAGVGGMAVGDVGAHAEPVGHPHDCVPRSPSPGVGVPAVAVAPVDVARAVAVEVNELQMGRRQAGEAHRDLRATLSFVNNADGAVGAVFLEQIAFAVAVEIGDLHAGEFVGAVRRAENPAVAGASRVVSAVAFGQVNHIGFQRLAARTQAVVIHIGEAVAVEVGEAVAVDKGVVGAEAVGAADAVDAPIDARAHGQVQVVHAFLQVVDVAAPVAVEVGDVQALHIHARIVLAAAHDGADAGDLAESAGAGGQKNTVAAHAHVALAHAVDVAAPVAVEVAELQARDVEAAANVGPRAGARRDAADALERNPPAVHARQVNHIHVVAVA